MLRYLKVSRPLIVNMLLFVYINNFLKWEIIYIMTFNVVNWIFEIQMILRFSMQHAFIFKHTNGKCHACAF